MPLPGTVKSAPLGKLGFDSNTVVTAAVASAFFADGYRFCLRYIARGPQPPTDLSTSEATAILDSGLALMPVQHVAKSPWIPTKALGTQYGTAAGDNAAAVGFPADVSVWCDLEGVNEATTAQAVIDYCNAWYDAVKAAGFLPGLYVGSGAILNDQQLHSKLKFQNYWRSQSNVPNVDKRGYQMIQLFPETTVHGIGVDIDITQTDYQGDTAQWLVKTA